MIVSVRIVNYITKTAESKIFLSLGVNNAKYFSFALFTFPTTAFLTHAANVPFDNQIGVRAIPSSSIFLQRSSLYL